MSETEDRMKRWLGVFVVTACLGVAGWCPVEAKDHAVAKSLARTGLASLGQSSRACAADDLLGYWQLVAFDSSYRFRNPQAPYLFPHQVFHYSHQGGAKSAHSLRPISGDPDQLFEAVPLDMTYRIKGQGRVVLKARAQDETVETWTCRVITQDPAARGEGPTLQRGDLVMTLTGSHGQGLFVRHLRKRAA
ncbi:MAG: hypothetical protein KAY09_04420 [Nitrospira sp.]|nr:hypothetical protein [Nitrospira sp.]